ncbi:hypothetical protein Gotur_032825 [Gossypium turneri]
MKNADDLQERPLEAEDERSQRRVPKDIVVVLVNQEFYASLRDQESRNTEGHCGKQYLSTPASSQRKAKPTAQQEVRKSSHPKLDWMIHWMQELGLIFQEFARQNNIRVPNYTLNMFGSTQPEQEEQAHEREEEGKDEEEEEEEEGDDEMDFEEDD